MSPQPKAAYRIETERLVIRCWRPADAALLKSAIDANLDHLRPWMQWAHDEPTPLGQMVERLRSLRASFDRDEDYVYGIFDPDETRVLGGTGLHPRMGPHAREIGYWLGREFTGKGLATETAGALSRVALEWLELDRVEIRCGPKNSASYGVAERLGFEHECTLKRRTESVDGALRDTMIWSLFASDLPDTPASEVEVRAFDAAGNALD